MQALALPAVDVVDPELAGLERAVAGRDDEGPAQVRAALVGRDGEQLLAVLAQPLERPHLLPQPHLGPVLESLLGAEVDERLPLDLRMPGDVVDVLLRVDRRHLAPDLLEALDDPDRRVAMAGVVRRREPCRPRAENRDVEDAVVHGADASAAGSASSSPPVSGCNPSRRLRRLPRGGAGFARGSAEPELKSRCRSDPLVAATRAGACAGS